MMKMFSLERNSSLDGYKPPVEKGAMTDSSHGTGVAMTSHGDSSDPAPAKRAGPDGQEW